MLKLAIVLGLALAILAIVVVPGCIHQSLAASQSSPSSSSAPVAPVAMDVTLDANKAFAAGNQIYLYDVAWAHSGSMVNGTVKYKVRPQGAGAFSTTGADLHYCYTPREDDSKAEASWDTVAAGPSDWPLSMKDGTSGVLPFSTTWRSAKDAEGFDISLSVSATCTSPSGKRVNFKSNSVTFPGDEERTAPREDGN